MNARAGGIQETLIANVYTQLRWTRVFHGRTSKDSEHVCLEVHYSGNELLRYVPRFSSSLPFNPIRGNRWTDEPDFNFVRFFVNVE